jgi:rhodanese-related sulfurtransferase/DNA-binding MarR family transcriptional regulator
MADHHLKTELFDQFARIGGALASGRRIEILDVLANGERSVEVLAKQVQLSIANTSRHLQVLKEAGLVASRRESNHVLYRLATAEVYWLWASLRSLAANRLAEVERLVAAYVGSRDQLEPVTREDLRRRLAAGEDLLILDVRPRDEFRAAHLPGAISIPIDELQRRLDQLPRDRDVVAYCRGPYCAFAPEAVAVLRGQGFQARRLEDGLPEWAASGLPIEAG